MGFAAIGAAAGVAGAGVGVVGAIHSANAASQAAAYNQQIANQNAQVAKNNATYAAQAGDVQAGQAQQKTRAEVGALKASEAAAGVDVNSGSAVDVRSSARDLGELSAITVQSNAAREAYGYRTQAVGFENQGTLDATESENDTAAGEIGATTSLIGGLGQSADNYANFLLKSSGMVAPTSTPQVGGLY
jgi:hypothetical protein